MSTYIADVLDNDGNSIRPITDWKAVQNAPDFASQIQDVKNSLTGDSGTWTTNGLQFLNGAGQADGTPVEYKYEHIGAYKALMISGAIKLPGLGSANSTDILQVPVPDWWNNSHCIVLNYLVPTWDSTQNWFTWNDGKIHLTNNSGSAQQATSWMDFQIMVLC